MQEYTAFLVALGTAIATVLLSIAPLIRAFREPMAGPGGAAAAALEPQLAPSPLALTDTPTSRLP